MTVRPEPWENHDPEHFRFEPMDANSNRMEWKVLVGSPCRYTVGPNHATCKRPSMLAIMRGTFRRSWWPYCAEHTYGRWVEDGKVMQWRLVPNADG